MSYCNKCKTYTCTCKDTDDCGCSHQHSAACSFYKGTSYTCIPVTKGMDLEKVIGNIADYICNELTPPSGHVTTVSTCDSNDISITPTVVNAQLTDYEVCLNPDIRTDIADNTSSIATINACLADTVKDLVSDSLTITEDSSNSCGRTLRLEYSPSAITSIDGIIYNNFTSNGTNGGGGTQTLKSFTHDYETNNDIATGDEVRIQATGKTEAVSGITDTIILDLYDSNSATQITSFTVAGATNKVGYASWRINAVVSVVDPSLRTAIFSAEFLSNFVEEGQTGFTNKQILMVDDTEIGNVDFTALTIRVRYINDSTAGSSNNYAKRLMVEVRKKI